MSFVESFTHLKDLPKSNQALPLLQRIASLVKPIMRKHDWRLPVLAEFFPDNDNLVGLNVNGGEKIMLRLRPSRAPDTFYMEDQLVDVMLHELAHNAYGPHDLQFYKFLAGLTDEYEALRRSGYAGEGFHSKGIRLGINKSHNPPPHISRSKALEAAERRRTLGIMTSGGGRLGGRIQGVDMKGISPRELAAQGAERRARDEKSCGTSGTVDSKKREAVKVTKGGMEETAEVVDLTLDDDVGGCITTRERTASPDLIILGGSVSTSRSLSSASKSGTAIPQPRIRTTQISTTQSRKQFSPKPHQLALSARPSITLDWTCSACTLLNPPLVLQCSACLSSRPKSQSGDWMCTTCGETGMPHDFWSCRFCGSIKSQSVVG